MKRASSKLALLVVAVAWTAAVGTGGFYLGRLGEVPRAATKEPQPPDLQADGMSVLVPLGFAALCGAAATFLAIRFMPPSGSRDSIPILDPPNRKRTDD